MKVFVRIVKESTLFALSAALANKMRTLLTLLGITIGIFSIILVFSVLDGLERQVRNSINALGENVVYIQKWPWVFDGEFPWWRYVNRPVPHMRELPDILRRAQTVEAAAFMASRAQTVEYGANSIQNASLVGVSEDYDRVRILDIAQGRYLSDDELERGSNVVVIGIEIAEALFGEQEPLGRYIRFFGRDAQVVGVFQQEGTATFGESHDDWIVAPLLYINRFADVNAEAMNPQILVSARPGIANEEMISELTGIMRAIRRLRPAEEDNFALNQTSLIAKQTDSLFAAISLAGWIIGGFSILVGGFGIANIMFVSVRERTSIIGIQKALGAKRFFILFQFLFESVLLSLMGGLVGLLLALGATAVISQLANMDFNLTLGNVLLGINVSAIIGVVSGFMPAWAASRLDPVEAIRTTG